MELFDKIKTALEQLLNTTISVGILPSSQNSICIRLSPGADRTAYLDRGRVYRMSFQVLVKNNSQKEAIRLIHEIADYLDQLTTGDLTLSDNRFQFIQCEVYNQPNFVEKTEANEYIYTALFNAEYEKKGE